MYLSSKQTGTPRWYYEKQLDAQGMNDTYSNTDLFITMTPNASWPKYLSLLSISMKVNRLINYSICKKELFGLQKTTQCGRISKSWNTSYTSYGMNFNIR